VLRQLVDLIPTYRVARLSRECDVDQRARTFSPWSHVVALMYAQLARSVSLNDVCDALELHQAPLRLLRGATPPSRNALSHASKVRNCGMAEKLFWEVMEELQKSGEGFGQHGRPGFAWRFRRTINVVDSTVIHLVSWCVDWAQHKRRKAAARMHMCLNAGSLLPRMVAIDPAKVSELRRVRQLCAKLQSGEIVLFDRGYQWFEFLHELRERGVYFVIRGREGLRFTVKKKRSFTAGTGVLSDEEVMADGDWVKGDYPDRLRRVRARVQIDGKMQEMTFLTNNLEWSAQSVADLYRCRWQIEAFFKQIKQTLQLRDFLGHSANAVSWQIWTALLVYVLMRFQQFRSGWQQTFARLFTVLRAALWLRIDLTALLQYYGTASVRPRCPDGPLQRWLPGFDP
jgi:hypothetical protein